MAAGLCIAGAALVALAPMLGTRAAGAVLAANLCWAVGNAIWLIISLAARQPAMAVQFATFWALSVLGVANWAWRG